VSIKPTDEFVAAKAQTEAKIKELKANIAEADRVIKTADREDNLSTVLLAKDQFEAELKGYEKVNFISYDDFVSDYSKILDWMF
jgi:chaperonin cofactor prefoldin